MLGSAQYQSHAFPLRVDTTCPHLSSSQQRHLFCWLHQATVCAPDGGRVTPGTKGCICPCSSLTLGGNLRFQLRLRHFWPNWTAQYPAQSQRIVPTNWEYHCHTVQGPSGHVRKKRNKNIHARQMQPGLLMFFILRGLTGALSVCLFCCTCCEVLIHQPECF